MTPAPAVWFDHCVVGINDLGRGISVFENLTGVRPAMGGAHPSLGTENALVSLGEGHYLEILAPSGARLQPWLARLTSCVTLTPFLWALATDDLSGVRQLVSRAGFVSEEPTAGSRVTQSGDVLHWSMCLMATGSPHNSPFFIEWAPGMPHPSSDSPSGCALRSFRVASDDQDELQRLLHVAGYETLMGAPPTDTMITLDTPRGEVTLE